MGMKRLTRSVFRRRPAIEVAVILAIAVFVLVATIVQAIRQDSWEPVWTTAWVPALGVALVRPSGKARACRRRLSSRA
jgi:asparagine N-glycosylation enzyme membrane subunit Stt3